MGTNYRSSVYILQHTLVTQHSFDFVIRELAPVCRDVRITVMTVIYCMYSLLSCFVLCNVMCIAGISSKKVVILTVISKHIIYIYPPK